MDAAESETAFDFDAVITKNCKAFASWTLKTFEVKFEAGEGASYNPATQYVKYGNKVSEVSDPTSVANDFKGWYIDAEYSTA